MRRRTILVLVVFIGAAGLVAATLLAANSLSEPATVTLLYPKEQKDDLFWPTNHSWLWSVSRLDPSAKGEALSLVARVVRKPLRKGESPTIGPRTISKVESEAEISLGKMLGVQPSDPATVSVQLIDLAEAGVPAGNQPLRLLLRLQVGSSQLILPSSQSAIKGDRFVGQTIKSDPKWKDGELHLQCLFVQEGDQLATYDIVVIVQSE